MGAARKFDRVGQGYNWISRGGGQNPNVLGLNGQSKKICQVRVSRNPPCHPLLAPMVNISKLLCAQLAAAAGFTRLCMRSCNGGLFWDFDSFWSRIMDCKSCTACSLAIVQSSFVWWTNPITDMAFRIAPHMLNSTELMFDDFAAWARQKNFQGGSRTNLEFQRGQNPKILGFQWST